VSVWRSLPLINVVYEAILSLAGNSGQVNEGDLYPELERRGYKVSPMDLTKVLMMLEIYGYIEVESSGKDERIIKLPKERRGEHQGV